MSTNRRLVDGSPARGDGDRHDPDLSVVVPLYNEQDNVAPLYEALRAVLSDTSLDYEIIFVDDGSSDETFSLARDIALADPHLRIIRFRRNYGQTPAMAAGIDHAQGRIIITMDGDLQNDPEDIPLFIDKLESGYDIVVGWRFNRQDKLITRKIPSRIANWLIGKVTGVPIKDNGCSLKAYRADVIKRVPLYSEMHRFIPAMSSLAGTRIAEIKVRHHARRFGTSKYGLSRIYKVLLDLLSIKGIVGFVHRPLIWFSMLALPFGLLGMILIGHGLYQLVVQAERFSVPLAGTGLLFGALAFFMFMLGALGELIYKTGDVRARRFSDLTATLSSDMTDLRGRTITTK